MKRALIGLAALVAVLLCAIAGVGIATFGGMSELIDGRQIGPAVTIKDGYVAAYLVETGGGAFLVDTGNDRACAAILAGLDKRRLAPEDVRAVFITHGHPDHLACASRFPGARVYALDRELPVLEGKAPTHGPLPELFGPNEDPLMGVVGLTDGATVAVGDKIVQIFAVPGHTAGSAAYLVDGALFVGDSGSALGDGSLIKGPYIFTDDQAENLRSLHALAKRLEGTRVDWIVPAHTGPLAGLGPLGSAK